MKCIIAINPYAEIGPEFEEMLGFFFQWHDAKYGADAKKLPYFPTFSAASRNRESFGTALGAAGQVLNTGFDPQQALYNRTLQVAGE